MWFRVLLGQLKWFSGSRLLRCEEELSASSRSMRHRLRSVEGRHEKTWKSFYSSIYFKYLLCTSTMKNWSLRLQLHLHTVSIDLPLCVLKTPCLTIALFRSVLQSLLKPLKRNLTGLILCFHEVWPTLAWLLVSLTYQTLTGCLQQFHLKWPSIEIIQHDNSDIAVVRLEMWKRFDQGQRD